MTIDLQHNKKQEWILNFIICAILICLSGTIQFTYIWHSQSIVVAFLFSLGLLLFKHTVSYNNLLIVLVLSLDVIINSVIYSDNLDGHISLIMLIVTCCVFCEFINWGMFKHIFVWIVFVFAIISLICFSFFLINPQFIFSHVPIISYWDLTSRYAYVFNFPVDMYTLRNFGPFHEGGMWAVFLNLALLWLLEENEEKDYKIIIMTVILIITIVTTVSTTGFIVCTVIMIFKFFDRPTLRNVLLGIIAIGSLIVVENNLGIVSNKLTMENTSFTARTSEFSIFLDNVWESPIFGIGYQNNSYISEAGLTDGTNGILSTLVQFGLLGGSLILTVYVRGIGLMARDCYDFVLKLFIIAMFFMSEPTIFAPLFMCFLFESQSAYENVSEGGGNPI